MLGSDALLKAFSLENKTALVTGAGSGLGAMISLALARAGAYVVAWGKTPAGLIETVKNIEITLGAKRARYYSLDITDGGQRERAYRQLQKDGCHIDILVNAAGINLRVPAGDMTAEDWDKTISVNLSAPFHLSQYFAPLMAHEKAWGRIINISSLQCKRAFPDSIPYGASKGGVEQLTRALAEAYSPDGVLVNAIAPGFFLTKLTASLFEQQNVVDALAAKTMVGRNGVATDIFGISVFLSSEACGYITGQTIFLDGGFSAK
ncbi:MAG: SDR family oxidoreductase [Spirochaetota bacterium]